MATPVDIESKIFSNVTESRGQSLDPATDNASDDAQIDTRFQDGIQNIEAITIVWSKTALWAAFVLIWLVYFTQGLVSGISSALIPYVTSDFAMHSLTPTTSVISSVVGGVSNLSIAKFLDVFGRPHGFLLCTVLATVGLAMSAACNNVEAYAASQVFYTVGINEIGFSLTVFIADITMLKNRGLVQSLCASANIITAWLGGPISTAFLSGAGWRWAFGMETILVPFATLPLFALFIYHYFNAKKQGLVQLRPRHTPMYYIREFDVVGLLSLSLSVAFFLLPFILYALQAKGWNSPILICFLIFGTVIFIGFAIWESIGQAFGLTVSAATWQDQFPKAVMKYLPPEDMANIEMTYTDSMTQLSYPVGGPTRIAIQQAYGDAQNYLFITATAVWVLGIVGTLMWRDIDLKSIKQTKGRVY